LGSGTFSAIFSESGANALRVVIQRVTEASVTVHETVVGKIKHGLVLLIGVGQGDSNSTVDRLVDKIVNLRIFADENGKTNLGIRETGGELLLISQFTLYADCRKGRRPAFTDAAVPDVAERLYDYFVTSCRERNLPVACGQFAADMKVSLVNDGPMTIILDSQVLEKMG
jgi:D-tyrosyl-tRNA(Tyr) deacylase